MVEPTTGEPQVSGEVVWIVKITWKFLGVQIVLFCFGFRSRFELKLRVLKEGRGTVCTYEPIITE